MTTETKAALWALAALAVVLLLFGMTDVDLLLQDRLYDWQASGWLWDKREPVARLLFYDGPKVLLVVFGIGCLFAVLGSRWLGWARTRRRGLAVVFLSLVLVPATAVGLKGVTNIACPAQLERYGGPVAAVPIFSSYPDSTRPQRRLHCFPAGHASGGFALLSLVYLVEGRAARRRAVLMALAAGGMMGAYKMAIGDHFLSHTLVTLTLAMLLVALIGWATRSFAAGGRRPVGRGGMFRAN